MIIFWEKMKTFSNNKNDVDLFGKNKKIVNDMESTRIERAKYNAKQEVLSYLIATEKCIYPKEKLDPLKWWQDNNHLYPNVVKCAQMWLSAPAISTPSECVFSICSVVDMKQIQARF